MVLPLLRPAQPQRRLAFALRISHIQPMREYRLISTTHGLVASALAVGVLLAIPFEGIARSEVSANAIRGPAHVIDGDTISIGETRIRLEGIDAPETGQTCKRKWFGSWPCGAVATEALTHMLENRTVSC